VTAARRGYAWGLLGVLGFSLTLPATRVAVAELPPLFVGLGRELVAAALATPLLLVTRQPRLTAVQLKTLALVIAGVVVGFPIFTALAMGHADASHGAVVLGLLPLATAVAGFMLNHERPSPAFWVAALLGSTAVIAYSFSAGAGRLAGADAALGGAVVAGAIGYAAGAKLAREIGAWPVICWALVVAAPLLLPVVVAVAWQHGLQASPRAWSGFAYVSLISALLGFFAWYRGLDLGGVARVSQVMLLQPFFTLGFAALLLEERITPRAVACAAVVAASILISRRSRVHHREVPRA
jgi:drug/metabolite transporter (DMT)-like permease